MPSPLAVIAIGGNSLIKDSKHMAVADQYQAAGETSHHIAALVAAGYRVVVTHGNGPQVGFIPSFRSGQERVGDEVPLDSRVADTQGAIGYQVGQTLANELRRQNLHKPIATVVTQVLVDKADPAFGNPTKPIGPFYSEEDARTHRGRRRLGAQGGCRPRLAPRRFAQAPAHHRGGNHPPLANRKRRHRHRRGRRRRAGRRE